MAEKNSPTESAHLKSAVLRGNPVSQRSSVEGQAPTVHVGQRLATRLVRRYVADDLNVLRVNKLQGGSMNQVLAFATDGEPAQIVAKIHTGEGALACQREIATLHFFRDQTDFPVPETYASMIDDPDLQASGLLMQRIQGANLSDARLSPAGFVGLQQDFAEHIARLHSLKSDGFGPLNDKERSNTWLKIFQPMIEREFAAVRETLSARVRQVVDDVIEHLDRWLDSTCKPTLVHGDLWATNVMVDDRHPDRPRVLAFLDSQAGYCDPEYELAYLRLFRTVSTPFFTVYRKYHPLRDGFQRRCGVYWLHTMMLHVRIFGEQYLPMCEQIAGSLRQTA